jgi:hypothetical protein
MFSCSRVDCVRNEMTMASCHHHLDPAALLSQFSPPPYPLGGVHLEKNTSAYCENQYGSKPSSTETHFEKAMHASLSDPSGGDEMHSDQVGDDLSDFDSLFDEPMVEIDNESTVRRKQDRPARRSPPRPGSPNFVPGLYFHWPTIVFPPDLERRVILDCLTTWFLNHPPRNHDPQSDLDSFLESSSFSDVNQVMLFNRTDGMGQSTPSTRSIAPAWLPCLTSLLAYVSESLAPPVLDIETWSKLIIGNLERRFSWNGWRCEI